jgi:hypothetical protein
MYSHGRHKISNLMNIFLYEFLDLIPAIILVVLFFKINVILLLRVNQTALPVMDPVVLCIIGPCIFYGNVNCILSVAFYGC